MSEDYEARAHKQLQIESWSNSARTLLIRGATDGGPFAEQHTTNADRSRATDTYELHGVPTKLQVSPSVAPVRRGECYVRITLLMDGEPVQRLASAYLTDSKTLSWPPGQYEGFTEGPGLIYQYAATNPGAGAEVLVTVPTNARWRLIALKLNLITDATVVDRSIKINVDDVAVAFYNSGVSPIVAASLTRFIHFIAGYTIVEAAFDATGYMRMPLPLDLYLFQGWRIQTSTGNIQDGDLFYIPYLVVEEWIEE